jgi:hypothetical protein
MSENIPLQFGPYSSAYGSTGYDKLYSASEISALFNGLILDGVYLSGREDDAINKQFKVEALATPGMAVKVAPGRAWIKGHYVVSDSEDLIAISSAGVLSRIDALVIELDTTGNSYDPGPVYTERCASFKIIEGVPSEHPEKPKIDPEEGIYQYPIAYITVDDGVTAIQDYDIEYVVGISTPYFAWLGERLSIAELYSKWETELARVRQPFLSWETAMKGMLGDGDNDYTHLRAKLDDILAHPYVSGTLPRTNESVYETTGDGSKVAFELEDVSNVNVIADILVDGVMVHEYSYDHETNTVTLKEAPANGDTVKIYYVPTVPLNTYTLYFEEVSNV